MAAAVQPNSLENFDPFSPAVLENPYPFYRVLREHAPVHPVVGTDYYSVSRYGDIVEAAMNTTDYSSNLVAILLTGADGRTSTFDASGMGAVDVLAIADPPDHGRQRKITQGVFSPR